MSSGFKSDFFVNKQKFFEQSPKLKSNLYLIGWTLTLVGIVHALLLSDYLTYLFFTLKAPNILKFISVLSIPYSIVEALATIKGSYPFYLCDLAAEFIGYITSLFSSVVVFIFVGIYYLILNLFHVFEHGFDFKDNTQPLAECISLLFSSLLDFTLTLLDMKRAYLDPELLFVSYQRPDNICIFSKANSCYGYWLLYMWVYSWGIEYSFIVISFLYMLLILCIKYFVFYPIKYIFFKPFYWFFYYLFNIDFDIYETIYHIYGFSEPASEKMYSIVEMYHNTAIVLSYVFVVIFIIIGITIKLFKADNNRSSIPFDKRVEYLLDALFVLAPIIIVYYLTVPAVSFILHGDRFGSYTDTLFSIEVVGHQWYWSYFISSINSNHIFDLIYIVADSEFMTQFNSSTTTLEFDQMIDNEADFLTRCFEVNKHLVLPVNECIRCFVTSEDVIHSWALPQLGIKIDAIPGRIQAFPLSSLKTGIFYGQCSELCGVNHAFMPIVVEFVELESFFDWLIKETKVREYKYLLETVFSYLFVASE